MSTKQELAIYDDVVPGGENPAVTSFKIASDDVAGSSHENWKGQPQAGKRKTTGHKVISELDNDRLFITGEGAQRYISEDLGQSWSSPTPMFQDGVHMISDEHPEVGSITSTALLNSGDLGIIYSKKSDLKTANYKAAGWYFAASSDDGNNWTKGNPIDIPSAMDVVKGWFVQFLWKNLTHLSDGRLIVPSYWEIAGRHPGMAPAGPDPVTATIQGKFNTRVADGHLFEAAMGGCFTYQSDDMGKNWKMSTGSTMVWPLPSENNIGGFGACWEPDIVELKDGRLLMFMRTHLGRFYQSFSEDGGDQWTLPEPTELATGDVPCSMGRLKTTGDLVVIWNQSSQSEIQKGYSRGRLSVATSPDDGKSWRNHKTLILSEGMKNVGQVELPPIKHVRPLGDLGVLPDGFRRAHYPDIAFVQDHLIVMYQSDTWPGGDPMREYRLQAIPEKNLYR